MLNKTVCEFGWLVLVLNEPFFLSDDLRSQ